LPSAAGFRTFGVLSNQGAILSSSELADQRRRRLLGLGVTFLAALFVSLVTTFARIAYESGSNPATQVFLRSLCMMLVLGGLQLALGRSLMLPRRTIFTTIAFGLCILVMSFGYLSSVFYISVSLAVLLLYTYPLMVGIASPLLGRERMTWLKALCLIGAFTGLVVASSEGFGALDWRGIGFALAAAGSLAVIALWGGNAMSRAHPFVMNAWMNLWVVVAVGLYLALGGGPHFPQSAVGWLATLAVCLCYMLGILFLFVGLMLISPAQSALTMNLEPLFSTIAAILLLHEAVALRQWIGMAILLIFLAISTLAGMARRGKA
jgi:drug/metabolite transporter (DMT)-like permease